MDALCAEPIERFATALDHFLFAPELRLLYATADPAIRNDLLEVAAACEHSHPVHTMVAVLETGADATDGHWAERGDELRQNYDELRQLALVEPDGDAMPELPPRSSAARGLACFAADVAAVARALPAACDVLTVVLAPIERDSAASARWESDLRALLSARSPELARARFVVVDVDGPSCEALVRELDEAASSLDARVPHQAASAALETLLVSLQRVPAGACGSRALGMAGPSIAPPPRPGATSQLPPPQVRDAAISRGVRPELVDADWARRLAVLELGASQAAAKSDHERACVLQRQAVNMLAQSGDAKRTVGAELALVAYALAGDAIAAAEHAIAATRARAVKAQLAQELVIVDLVRASVHIRAKRPGQAAELYGELARRVEARGDNPILAIELYRLCGATAEALPGYQSAARTAYERSVGLAQRTPAVDRMGSSAPIAARSLGAMHRRSGELEAARRCDALAEELEAPPPGLAAAAVEA